MAGEHGFSGAKDIYNLSNILSRLDALERNAQHLRDAWPVGSIYMSIRNTNPGTLFGGTWVAWGQGRVPIGVGSNGASNYGAPEGTGGSEGRSFTPSGSISEESLSIRQIPQHQHRIWPVNRHISVQGGGGDGNYNALYTSSMHEVPSDVEIAWSENAYNGVGPDGKVPESNQAVGEPHGHRLSMSGVNVDVRQPYITCYMWKRTA